MCVSVQVWGAKIIITSHLLIQSQYTSRCCSHFKARLGVSPLYEPSREVIDGLKAEEYSITEAVEVFGLKQTDFFQPVYL